MGFYALMNVAALGCHCLLSRNSPWQMPLVSLDIAATACCAFCAAYACLIDELGDSGKQIEGGPGAGQPGTGKAAGGAAATEAAVAAAGPLVDVAAPKADRSAGRRRHMLNLLTWCGLFNTSAFWGLHIPLMPELLYLGTALFAAVVVGRYVLRRAPRVGRQSIWVGLLFGGGALALAALEADAPLCRAGLGRVANAATIVFLGCHVVMAALLLYVRDDVRCRRRAARGGRAAGLEGRDGLHEE